MLDTNGLKQVIPVALSRSQTVDIKVPTRLDLLVLSVLAGFVALGLVIFGRRRILASRMRSYRPAYQTVQNDSLSNRFQASADKANPDQAGLIKWS